MPPFDRKPKTSRKRPVDSPFTRESPGRSPRKDGREDALADGQEVSRSVGQSVAQGHGQGRRQGHGQDYEQDYEQDRAPKNGRAGTQAAPGRIAKVLARAGVASRREVERMIAQGRVALDGQVLQSPALVVDGVAGITVDGEPVAEAQSTRLWRFHKPFGLVTTHSDPQGRPTVFESLPPNLPRVISIGRLDQQTEGLLLLTNDGGLGRYLELPATALRRTYIVRVSGEVSQQELDALQEGLTLEGVRYGPVEASFEVRPGPEGAGTRLRIVITEGKNREVRRIVAYLGLSVLQLTRVSFGPFELGSLPIGALEEVPSAQVAELVARMRQA